MKTMIATLLYLGCLIAAGLAAKVEFDSRSFIVDGKRELIFGGCVHYPVR